MELSRATWLVATFATKLGNTRESGHFHQFAAATILNPIADTGSTSIGASLSSAELSARDNREPRSNNTG